MKFWIGRIQLKSGEIVTERELLPTENAFEGVAPKMGEVLSVRCRGRELRGKVVWLTYPMPESSENPVVLRVQEV